jgi:hypothetical protein
MENGAVLRFLDRNYGAASGDVLSRPGLSEEGQLRSLDPQRKRNTSFHPEHPWSGTYPTQHLCSTKVLHSTKTDQKCKHGAALSGSIWLADLMKMFLSDD